LILQRKGHLADTAETAREALEKIGKERYDVALIDVMLPDLNGLDLLKYIPSETKKIVITGTQTEESRRKAISEGAEEYLLKPVKTERLLEIIA
jgi:DNA-binding NtrC family response regulator